jgi:hypothetical protein
LSFAFDLENVPSNLQVELTDVQIERELKEKFTSMKQANIFAILRNSK